MMRVGSFGLINRLALSAVFLTVTLLLSTFPSQSFSEENTYQTLIAEGDLHWFNRATGADGPKGDPAEINQAISSYRQALGELPGAIPARWRLMRAFYFKGEFTMDNKEERRAIYKEGIKIGGEAMDVIRSAAAEQTGKKMNKAGPEDLAVLFKGQDDITATFFWYSVQWGNWAMAYGKLNAARKGVAGKIRDLAEAVVMVDPDFEDGGGYRVLGRLHHETPDIPLITGWVSKKKSVEFLRKANKSAPNNFLNILYLSEALGKKGSGEKDEAIELLEKLLHRSATQEFLVEERKTLEDARVLLEQWGG